MQAIVKEKPVGTTVDKQLTHVVVAARLPQHLRGNSMFEKYSAYLDGDFSVDYWSDEGICYATTFLEEFTVSDWDSLKCIVQYKPIPWLIRCAETLGDVGGVSSFDVLLELIAMESDEVKISALDSMNSRLSLGFALGESAGKIRSAINTARNSAGPVASMVLDSLERKL